MKRKEFFFHVGGKFMGRNMNTSVENKKKLYTGNMRNNKKSKQEQA